MLFYTFNLVISAEKTNEHRRRKKHIFKRSDEIEISRYIFAFTYNIFNNTAAERAEMLLWEESIHNWNRKTEEQGKENEWMNIHRGLHLERYNIIMSIRVFYWLIKVDVINCCLIHNTNAANISTLWENDITRNEHNQTRHDGWMIDQQWFRFVRDSSVIIGRRKFSRNYFPAKTPSR